ncbi:INSIG domain-containing protein [Schizosaccharomyces japonicus yFS275]|uniref:INSIG domain-containing protein n=1 Tax=Schizosaccharomyces japonicus (strain yFS275 / FY16936) TaxID=402676 RepID=B6JWJ4_SCHJY|nr:INSIG domain-containing protein [Schizosaccharomyces japonicus yFS275]EEB05745.1 INSIG domain-containing protein [Schizosaccharomyces japonicus yFS275]
MSGIVRPRPRYAEGFQNRDSNPIRKTASVLSLSSLSNSGSTLWGLFERFRLESDDEDDSSGECPSPEGSTNVASSTMNDRGRVDGRVNGNGHTSSLDQRPIPHSPAAVSRSTVRFRVLGVIIVMFLGWSFTYLAEKLLLEARLPGLRFTVHSQQYKPHWSLLFGFAAILVGFSFPYADRLSHNGHRLVARPFEWNLIVRSIMALSFVLIGLKRCLGTDVKQTAIGFAVNALSVWFIFDHTKTGFVMSSFFSSLGTFLYTAFVEVNLSQGESIHISKSLRYWLPSIIFFACTVIGNVGRLVF